MAIQPALPTPYFLARPRGAPRAGVIVLMEGNGIGWQLLRVCERLAVEGYLAIAPDLFHRVADGHGDWQHAFASQRNEESLADIRACAAILRSHGVSRVGVTGFCNGGRLSYLSAVSGVDVQAAAPFYGAGIERILGDPGCPLLVFFAGNDEYVPTAAIEAVRARHPRDVVVYPEARHGFMRDGSDSYHEPSARAAWPRLLAFLAAHLDGAA
jgi:carboxymethylenebutenolidase